MFVIYKISNGNEMIVTTPENEEQTIRKFFESPGMPSIHEYNREMSSECAVEITSEIRVL